MSAALGTASAGGWTASPGSLQRIGLGVRGIVPEGAGAAEGRVALRRRLAEAFADRGADGLDGSVEAESEGLRTGDRLLLITREVSSGEDEVRWERLRARLGEKNFLRAWAQVRDRDLASAVRELLAGRGCAVEISVALLDALREATGGAVVSACRWSAHLAMTNFVERTPGFRAEGFGRVLGRAGIELRLEGTGADGADAHAGGGGAS